MYEYEDRPRNHDPEIHEEYPDTPFRCHIVLQPYTKA